ncbi:MAG: arginase family protein [Chitinophagaceae bacterium]
MFNTIEIQSYVNQAVINQNEEKVYLPGQLGAQIKKLGDADFDLEQLDIVILGCSEQRGKKNKESFSNAPNAIREELYDMYLWHKELKIGDIGNVVMGETLQDTGVALMTILEELHNEGKKVIVLGGSHDLTLQQYNIFKRKDELIDFTVVDQFADMSEEQGAPHNKYLFEILTETPNFVRHFNLIGFQSYNVNPKIIEVFDKLRFDCVRLGKAREDLNELEPMFRQSHVVSLDMNVVRYSDAPANSSYSPNGFMGDEMCTITKQIGMSSHLASFGIFGYEAEKDQHRMTAKLIAQMIWYFFDGLQIAKSESELSDREQFVEYQVSFTDVESTFLKSKNTNRWWMKLPDEQFIPCTYNDYLTACHNEVPERWLRELERLV